MSQKFHINSAGDVRVCNATIKACRFGDADHFTDRSDARREVEKRLESELGTSGEPLSKKKTRTNKNDDSELKSTISRLTQNKKPTNAELQKIGKVLDDELRKRLDFDPFDHELSKEEIKAVQNANHVIFSSLVTNGGDIPTYVDGPHAAKLHEAVRILPDSVKVAIGKAAIFTKTANKNNTLFDGRHRFGRISRMVQARAQISPTDIPEKAPDGSLIPSEKYASLQSISDYNGFRVWEKNGDSTLVEERWIGDKPKGEKVRKIADQAEVYVDGQLVTLNKPVYALSTEEKTIGSEISAKKSSDDDMYSSVLLHEFCHAVQYRTIREGLTDEAEESMFAELAVGPTVQSKEYNDKVYRGFPTEYMGHENGAELLPVATEGFFYPAAQERDYLYGSNRGENADKVRQWVSGLWISLNNR